MRIWSSILVAAGGLFGAAGVALAAYAAHQAGGDVLVTASSFLLFHAGILVSLGLLRPASRGSLIGGSLLAVGTLLFSGDLALRVIAQVKPWAMAAPTGGSILILGWLWLAAWGIAAALRRD